nr:LysR family transcriptional regulator [Nocardioides flavescens]
MPELDALRLLVAVARTGSIGAAAKEAGVSQQAASQRLRTIEAETGLPLLQRGPTGTTLTPSGRLVVEWSVGLLARADEMEAAVQTLRERRSDELHVFASMTTAEHVVPRWLVRLRRERAVSATMVATNTTGVLDAVRRGEADLGFTEGSGDLTGLTSRVVGGDQLVLVASTEDPWAERRSPLTAAVVSRRPLTSREPGSGTRQVAEDAFRAAGHPLAPPEVELTTNAAVLGAVRAGGAPALLSALTLPGTDDLVVLPVRGVDLGRDFTAVWLGGTRPPAGPVRDLLAIAVRAS